MASDACPPPTKRGLDDREAAAYVGLGETTFRAVMAADGVKPTWLTKGRRVWDVRRLDAWMDAKGGLPLTAATVEPGDEWLGALG
jgi:hypothetical protein